MSNYKLKGGKEIKAKQPRARKHMWWRYLLVFLGGMVTTAAIAGAAIGITGAVLTTKEVITMFGGNPNDILREDYQNISMIEMVQNLSTKKFETLGDIDKVTPAIKKVLDETINPTLDKELHFQYNWDELKIKPFEKSTSGRPATEVDPNETLGEYLGRAIKEEVTLASFISGDAPKLIDIFLYPKNDQGEFDYDHPYTLSTYINATSDFFDNIVNSIKIKDVVDIQEGDRLMEEIADWSITDFNQEQINTLSVGLFLDPDSENPLIQKLSTFTIGDLTEENLKALKIADIIAVNDDTPKILLALIDMDYTIGDLESTNLYNVLTVEQVFETEGNTFLTAIKDKYLSDLEDEDTILDLKLNEVFVTESETSIVARFGDKTLREITGDDFLSNMKITEAFSEAEIEENILLSALVRENPDVKMSDLSDFETIQNLYISDVITEEQIDGNRILETLVNNNTQIKDLDDAIDSLTLGQVLDIDSGSTKILQTLAETPINDLDSRLSNLTVDDVMVIEEGSYLDHEEIRNATVDDIDALMTALKNNLKLKDVIDIVTEGENKSPQILITLMNTKLVDLADEVNSLKLNQLIEIDADSHPILLALSNIEILDSEAFNEKLNNLMLCDVYTREQCEGILEIIWDNNNDGHILISELPGAMNDLPLVDVLAENIYVDGDYKEIGGVIYQRVNNTWWYLLTEEGETFSAEEEHYVLKKGLTYTLSGMDQLVLNFNYHIRSETIRDLYEADFILIDEEKVAKLDTVVIYQGTSMQIGDMTISQFVDYCLNIIQ